MLNIFVGAGCPRSQFLWGQRLVPGVVLAAKVVGFSGSRYSGVKAGAALDVSYFFESYSLVWGQVNLHDIFG